jgi:hypothetical protein
MTWTEFIWIRIGANERSCDHDDEPLGYSTEGNSLTVCETEGFCSMEYVNDLMRQLDRGG